MLNYKESRKALTVECILAHVTKIF
uniref:Uncharacterized protein n=1 Tax=Arundo donax TaxID=35708 RepID=A0A0A9AMN0_ARUDO